MSRYYQFQQIFCMKPHLTGLMTIAAEQAVIYVRSIDPTWKLTDEEAEAKFQSMYGATCLEIPDATAAQMEPCHVEG